MGVNWVGPAIMHFGTESSSAGICRRSPPGTRCGARVSASPTPAVTWRRCSCPPSASQTAPSSRTARRSGPPTPRLANWCFLAARTGRRSAQAAGDHNLSGADGSRRHQCSPDRLDDGAQPSERGLLRRCGPRARRDSRGDRHGLGRDRTRAQARARRDRPVRPQRQDSRRAVELVQGAHGPGAAELRGRVAQAFVRARIARLLSYRTLATSREWRYATCSRASRGSHQPCSTKTLPK